MRRRTANSSSFSHGLNNRKEAQAKRVPKVPGANGDRPLPKPQAIRCAGCENKKRSEGGLLVAMPEMIEAFVSEGNALPLLVE